MEGGSITGELLRYFGYKSHSPTGSAFIQQRRKINEFAFPALFSLFVKYTDTDKLYKGYRLLAADGSDIQIPADPKHTDSYFQGVNGQAPYSLLHLDAEKFPPEELCFLYGMRWGIETSFRELKYTVGLLHFHAKKVENITQEIYARLIMYNFSELITSHVVIQKVKRKHPCKANFSIAVQVCRQFLRGNISPPDVEATIKQNVSVIRTGRHHPRNIVKKNAVSFTYRVA